MWTGAMLHLYLLVPVEWTGEEASQVTEKKHLLGKSLPREE